MRLFLWLLCFLNVFTGTLHGRWWFPLGGWFKANCMCIWRIQSWEQHIEVYAAAEQSFLAVFWHKTHQSTMHEKGGSEPVTAVLHNLELPILEGRDVFLGIFFYSLCSLQLHAIVFSLWTGIHQRARPGPPVVVDKQLGAIRACSTESLSGGCLGDNGTLLVLIAPLELNKELDLPFSVFPSAFKLPERDSCFQETSSLMCRTEFTGTKSLEHSSYKLNWSFGLLPWRENCRGLYLLELRRELTSASKGRREYLLRSTTALGWELDLRGVDTCPSFVRKWRDSKRLVSRGVVLWRAGKCCCWESRGGGGDVLLRMGTSPMDEVSHKEQEWQFMQK